MPDDPPEVVPPRAAGRRRRKRPSLARRLLAAAISLLVIAGAVGYWALDRYFIDHVEIGDVAAYEAAVQAATDQPQPTTPAPASSSASQSPVVTATSYTSDDLTIKISTVVAGSGTDQVTYYVADVQMDAGTQLRGGFAQNKFGRNITSDTSDIAKSLNAVFAINGDYYGFRDNGIVIRNGVLYRDDGARTGLAIYRDGTMAIYEEKSTTGEELVAKGVWNTLSFGPGLLENGQIVKGIESVEIDNNFGLRSIQGRNPRTGIGMIEANHFVFVVVDGRSRGYSAGVTMTEFAQIFQGLGAKVAYNLDGGGSSTMYFNGSLVNQPLGGDNQRAISDILYFG